MKLFLREHLLLIAVSFVQIVFVTAVFWLDGYRDWPVAAYALLLGFCATAAFLFYRYRSHRSLYELLDQAGNGNGAVLEATAFVEGNAPLPSAMRGLLSEQYRAYEQLRLEVERSREAHAAFMNRWVHQMKTPLSVLELMLQEEQDERSASMREETERLRSGLETVLQLSRLETFEHDFVVERIPVRELLNEVILYHRRLFIRSGVYPVLEADEGLDIHADRKWVAVIVEQLLSNAVKYSKPARDGVGDNKGSRATVTIAVFRDGRGTVIEVRDQGIGIPASDLKRIFQPHYTGENGRVFKESTGMGLYIVKSAMDRMGYRVEAESETGKGTTIRLIFSK